MITSSPLDKPPIPPQSEEGLSISELREKLRDPSYLPTHEDIDRAFGSEEYSGELSDAWRSFCFNEDNPVFEVFNEEYINAFGDYLSQRVESLGASEDSPITILEVGAGNGRLSHFLQRKLEQILPGKVRVIATDSGKWNLKTIFPVEKIDHKEALQKYQPKIVVFSWMPYGEDFTDDFRATESVDEYLIIGERPGGNCGDMWRTWGEPSFDDGRKGEVAPHVADGFELEILENMSAKQICRTDSPYYRSDPMAMGQGGYYRSSTSSFKRRK